MLVGHSMGGMTVMSFAGQHPDVVRDRVLAVALIATSAGGRRDDRVRPGCHGGQVVGSFGPGVLTRLSRHAGPIGALRRMGRGVQDAVVQRWAFDSPVSPELVQLVGDMIFSTSFDVMAAFLPDFDVLDISADLAPLVGIETLVMNGAGTSSPRRRTARRSCAASRAPSTSSSTTPATSSCSSTPSWSPSSCSCSSRGPSAPWPRACR